MIPLVLGAEERAVLADLRERASKAPVDMRAVMERIRSSDGLAEHMRTMRDLTVAIPTAYVVTFTIENGHPDGTMRHMSMSVESAGRVPTPEAIWMVAAELGFVGGLSTCTVYGEALDGGGTAVNVVQPVRLIAVSHHGNA